MNSARIKEWWRLWDNSIIIGVLATAGVLAVIGIAWYVFQTMPANLIEGEVVNRDFTPAHYESEPRTRQVYDGQDCRTTTNSSGFTSTSCTSKYRSETYYVDVFYNDDWDIAVDGCSQNRRGDTICRIDWVDVSESVYDDCTPGEYWRRETACRLL